MEERFEPESFSYLSPHSSQLTEELEQDPELGQKWPGEGAAWEAASSALPSPLQWERERLGLETLPWALGKVLGQVETEDSSLKVDPSSPKTERGACQGPSSGGLSGKGPELGICSVQKWK